MNQGVRYEVPSVLLYLNRDDDCFQYIKWWTYNYSSRYQRGMGNDAGGERGNLYIMKQKGIDLMISLRCSMTPEIF